MASYSRTQRIGEEIRKVVSTMLISGIKDYRINSLISVTDVEVTSDLSYAYVYVSILGGNKESIAALPFVLIGCGDTFAQVVGGAGFI
ncbi:30S ribosome-binding factor RbfA, partial [Parabacteroides merdae]|nr:30S ribosome-binding factor RbfA [Parabacteroides merdae]